MGKHNSQRPITLLSERRQLICHLLDVCYQRISDGPHPPNACSCLIVTPLSVIINLSPFDATVRPSSTNSGHSGMILASISITLEYSVSGCLSIGESPLFSPFSPPTGKEKGESGRRSPGHLHDLCSACQPRKSDTHDQKSASLSFAF